MKKRPGRGALDGTSLTDRLRSSTLRAAAAARRLRGRDPASLALRDEMAALLDLAQNAVALHRLPKAREQMLARLSVT